MDNHGGPFFSLFSDYSEYLKAEATRRLMSEMEKGWASAEVEGWLSLDEVEARLGIDHM